MEPKNKLSELSDEKLLQRRDMFKGILIGMYVVCVVLIVLLVYIFFQQRFQRHINSQLCAGFYVAGDYHALIFLGDAIREGG